MITDWITINRVKISKAEQLYPRGLDWELKPGVNAIVGGTGLGKTTFVYALQYGIFGKMVDAGKRIEREFFKDRLIDRTKEQAREHPPTIEVHFSVGGSLFVVERNLLTGSLIASSCDGKPLSIAKYTDALAEKVGLNKDFPSLVQLQSHLLFFGEDRYLLAWDNRLQNEILNLILSDHATYSRLKELWDEVGSHDSAARNFSTDASKLEAGLKTISDTSSVDELKQQERRKELKTTRALCEARIANLQEELQKEQKLFEVQDATVSQVHSEFHRDLDRFETEQSAELDSDLLTAVMAVTPTTISVRHALERFFQQPDKRTCPCCGRAGISPLVEKFAEVAANGAKAGQCIVCNKEIDSHLKSTARAKPAKIDAPNASATRLQETLFARVQTKSRIESIRQDEARVG